MQLFVHQCDDARKINFVNGHIVLTQLLNVLILNKRSEANYKQKTQQDYLKKKNQSLRALFVYAQAKSAFGEITDFPPVPSVTTRLAENRFGGL